MTFSAHQLGRRHEQTTYSHAEFHSLIPIFWDNLVSKSRDAQASPRSTGCPAGCLVFRRRLCQEQTTTRSRDLQSSECVDRHHLLRKIIGGRYDRTFAVASQWPALICKTINAIVTENQMVEQPDAQQLSSFP